MQVFKTFLTFQLQKENTSFFFSFFLPFENRNSLEFFPKNRLSSLVVKNKRKNVCHNKWLIVVCHDFFVPIYDLRTNNFCQKRILFTHQSKLDLSLVTSCVICVITSFLLLWLSLMFVVNVMECSTIHVAQNRTLHCW